MAGALSVNVCFCALCIGGCSSSVDMSVLHYGFWLGTWQPLVYKWKPIIAARAHYCCLYIAPACHNVPYYIFCQLHHKAQDKVYLEYCLSTSHTPFHKVFHPSWALVSNHKTNQVPSYYFSWVLFVWFLDWGSSSWSNELTYLWSDELTYYFDF